MLLGAVTYNVLRDWDVETINRNLAAADFEAVELRTGHKHLVEPTNPNPDELREYYEELIAEYLPAKLRW